MDTVMGPWYWTRPQLLVSLYGRPATALCHLVYSGYGMGERTARRGKLRLRLVTAVMVLYRCGEELSVIVP